MSELKYDKTCAICQKHFTTGYRFKHHRYEAVYSKLFKKWRIRKKRETWDICDKCKETGFALIRNHLAIKTSDILNG